MFLILNKNPYKIPLILYFSLLLLALNAGGCTRGEIITPTEEKPGTITPAKQYTPTQLSLTATSMVIPMKTATPLSVQKDETKGQFGVFISKDDLDPSFVNFELNYFTGGAGGCYSYGQSEVCDRADSGTLSLYISGIYSSADQADYYEFPYCWYEKKTPCKSKPELGDMINFIARGYSLGEEIEFTLKGPNGEISHTSTVSHEVLIDRGCVVVEEEYDAARFSWVASPELGIGEYELSATGSTGSVSLGFSVYDNKRPNFGASFGADGHPLLLRNGENVQLVFAGYVPGSSITTLLFLDPVSITDVSKYNSEAHNFSDLVGFVDITINESGYAIAEFKLPTSLDSGIYSWVVPDIPNSCGPAASSIQFMYQNETNTILIPSAPYRVVNVSSDDHLNIRSGPGVSYEVVGIIPYNGTGIEVLGDYKITDGSTWFQIRYGEVEGWVNSKHISPETP